MQSDISSVMWVTDLYGQTLCNGLRVMTIHDENEESLTLQPDISSVMWVTDFYGQSLCNGLRVMLIHGKNEKSLTLQSGFSKVVAGAGFEPTTFGL